jgi:regulator of replication initiation timing
MDNFSVEQLQEENKLLKIENEKLKVENKILKQQLEVKSLSNNIYENKMNHEEYMDFLKFDYND